MNSPENIYLDRGNGYLRLRIARLTVRWTASMDTGMFIIEAPSGKTKTVGIDEIERAIARLADPTGAE